tara:strand:- start:490 stop:1473 length:984 start_codon:yes stop_codon:yes gene_type:complete
MPAKTITQLYDEDYLRDFLEAPYSAAKFRNALNEVMPRIYKMGYWREMVLEHTQSASDGYVSLPHNTDSIVGAVIDNNAVPSHSLWHDYRLFGTNDSDDNILSAFIDDGYAPIYRDILTTTTAQYIIQLKSIQPNNYLPDHHAVNVVIRYSTAEHPDGYQEETMVMNAGSTATTQDSAEAEVNKIHQIAYNNIPADNGIQIIAVDQVGSPAVDVTLGELPAGSGVLRYRRFRIGDTSSNSSAHMLLKRRWVDAVDSSETIHVPDRAILKHALLGKLSEDNADVQRAQYHWGICKQLLETDMDSYRGSTRPKVHIAPEGASSGMSGMY